MTEHVHEWRTTRMENGELSAVCQDETCGMGMMLSASQVDIRLNRYGKLRKATEKLSAEKARASANVIVSLAGNLPDATVYDYLVISNVLYADILESK